MVVAFLGRVVAAATAAAAAVAFAFATSKELIVQK